VRAQALAFHAAAQAFEVAVTMEHPGITAALRTCAAFEERYPDPDARLAAYDELERHFKLGVDPRDVRELRSLSANVRATMREVLRLAAGVRVRSWLELDVLQSVFDTALEPVFVAPVIPELPPIDAGTRRDAIVVWAPHLQAGDCALYAAALDDARMTVLIVGGRGDRVAGNAEYVAAEYAGEALGRAAVIVDTTAGDPGWAIALAALGRPMAVCVGSGAHAYLRGVTSFRPWMRGDVALAIAAAMGAPPPVVVADAPFCHPELVEGQPRSPLELLVADASGAPRAVVRAAEYRARGVRFELALAIGHPHADACAAMVAGGHDVSGEPVTAYSTIPTPLLETLRQCAFLADRIVYGRRPNRSASAVCLGCGIVRCGSPHPTTGSFRRRNRARPMGGSCCGRRGFRRRIWAS
jgi:hypothetical protein